MAVDLAQLEEYCPSCGGWVSYLAFNHSIGWCNGCVRKDSTPRCTTCNKEINPSHGRTTCHACRLELWYERHADEIEYLVVCKGYSVYQARQLISKMIRPICQWCGIPISGAKEGALFHKRDLCRKAHHRYKRMIKQGLPSQQALATIRRERP